ncbi:Protein LIKE EARLY STARVATION [Cardamine amara subsp. amara]|uniref:Protein LIKE EARLY STARVATION n=1 Tax=Cardamine amara subsp. amara TaxID=228776 RepID=A0ABD1AUK4_CARAN
MASRIGVSIGATLGSSHWNDGRRRCDFSSSVNITAPANMRNRRSSGTGLRTLRVSNEKAESYLDMWKNAVDREKKEKAFEKIAENVVDVDGEDKGGDLEKKSDEFQKILEVSVEERDRIQRMQVVDRAAAAISAARAILASNNSGDGKDGFPNEDNTATSEVTNTTKNAKSGMWSRTVYVPRSETSGTETPGPDFWSWTPPQDSEVSSSMNGELRAVEKPAELPTLPNPVLEKDYSDDSLSIPYESMLSSERHSFTIPPFESLIEVRKEEETKPTSSAETVSTEHDLDIISSANAEEAARVLDSLDESSTNGVSENGLKWWKQTGVEKRTDGVVCRWTMIRGVTADGVVEWQDKYWEASDDFGFKELGSEKSGRDAAGNVWREFWRESMMQENGVVHMEKTADKWGKSGTGDEWQEKWWEHYDATGKSEKWAHKWCSLDRNTPLDVGHAHVWHERWGEKYDGQGGSTKYTDKWAERWVGDGWDKWGDKWDENFNPSAQGVKQGETWWEGKHGDRWNRSWGEGHNGSGWIHKYGKSSSGEHWDTHIPQETWYERFPHFGFFHCFDNSVQLRAVKKPSDMS